MKQTKTHKQIILDYLQSLWMLNPDNPFIEGFKLQGKELNGFWSSAKADTRLRELYKEGKVLRTYRDGYACYAYIPSDYEVQIVQEREKVAQQRMVKALF